MDKIPNIIEYKGRKLPVYQWDDDHDEQEWISISGDDVSYVIGGRYEPLVGKLEDYPWFEDW
jgi:hypothetical protein